MVLEEQSGDNGLCCDNAVPYSCRLLLTQETNETGASPWSHPNKGVCHGVKGNEVKEEVEEKEQGGQSWRDECRVGGHASATKIKERLLDPRGTLRQQSSKCENKGKLCGISI